MKPFFSLMILLISYSSLAFGRVRTVEVVGDQVVTVRTSIGIATIIQVPDRPNSVVVGDQDSFKVEYLEQAITIKPLSPGAKSNLYVYTDWKRYNIELVSGPQVSADYVVYLELPIKKQKLDSPISWRKFQNSLKNESVSMMVKRIGTFRDDLLLVEFTLTSQEKININPEWFWITQKDAGRPIHNLVLSGLEVGPKKSINGLLQLRTIEFDNDSFRLELRRKKTSYLTLPGKASWK